MMKLIISRNFIRSAGGLNEELRMADNLASEKLADGIQEIAEFYEQLVLGGPGDGSFEPPYQNFMAGGVTFLDEMKVALSIDTELLVGQTDLSRTKE